MTAAIAGRIPMSPEAIDQIGAELERLKGEVERFRLALALETSRAESAEVSRDAWQETAQMYAKRITDLHSGILQSVDALREEYTRLNGAIKEVGNVADRTAQFATVLSERMDGFAARETL